MLINDSKKIQASVDLFLKILDGINLGLAHPSLIENIRIECYGSSYPLNHIALISRKDSRTLIVQPFEPERIHEIDKHLRSCGLNLNPQRTGPFLYIPIPPLSRERSLELIKHIKTIAEQQRVAIRNIRREMRSLKEVPDKTIEAMVKSAIKAIDGALEAKIESLNFGR